MPRVLMVVARDRHDLYEYFRLGFEGIDAVEVILDRRIVVAREDAPPTDPERRRDLAVHDELLLRGFIIRRRP
jgi:hypothetical protein